ncbi:MAG: NYN domain-containing protein [Chlamydiae bacterium]|nr:NYN domain-containing protein [Chlamydiota bacterium]MBI3276526.1 NYN domain-containing protein [Chlamydiota bacterium]
METGKVGRYLWALLIDERPEALNIIPIFILKVLETIRKFTSLLQQIRKSETPSPLQNFKKPPTLDPASSKWKEELNQAKRERLDAKFALDKSEAKNTQLEDRLQELQNLYKTTLTEAQGLKHEKNSFLKKIKELEHSVSEIKTERKDKESLESRLHQLERENKILKYELEKKDKTLEEFSKIKDEHEKLLKNKTLLQKRIDESEKLILFKTEEIDKIREEIKKEALIKKEARKVLKNPVPRVGIFVDVQNIFYASKERYERKLDFQKLLYQTLQGRKLVKAMAYVVITPEINQNNFMNTLETMGYETKTKNLKIRRDGSAKGDWDLGIAIDTISMADKLDVVVLVSGDGDFVDLVRMLKAKNIRVEVASFLHNSSADLIDSADFHFILDEKILLTS